MGPITWSTAPPQVAGNPWSPIVGSLLLCALLYLRLTFSAVLMVKRVIETSGAKAILVLPYVALVQEKVRWLRGLTQDLFPPTDSSGDGCGEAQRRRRSGQQAIRVIGFFGGGKVRATWDDFDIAVCTLEKVCILWLSSLFLPYTSLFFFS